MAREHRYWFLTIPFSDWQSDLISHVDGLQYARGQGERGEGGFEHWQLSISYMQKKSLKRVKLDFGERSHCEPSRSKRADEYVWKEDTRIAGTPFEYGKRAVVRSSKADWDEIWALALVGDYDGIPSSIRVQNYRTLRQISTDYAQPIGMVRSCRVFWGPTGTGKSRRAWQEAGMDAYPKDPRTKWWCGYRDHPNVVIDEFRGTVDVTHLLRWFDRYPVLVEIKGGAVVLRSGDFWITSNLHPKDWYPELDQPTTDALMRRLVITEFKVLNKNDTA